MSILNRRLKNQRGFSLIEILMVLVLIAVLAAIAINAFVNFRTEARDAALRADLKVLRTGIATQYGQMQLRCGGASGAFPPLANFNANDITSGATPCTAVQVAVASERAFVAGAIPVPPYNTTNTNTVLQCGVPAGDCTRGNAVACASAGATFTNQWCYNVATGELWIDSGASDGNGVRYDSY